MTSLTLDWLHVITPLGAIEGLFIASVLSPPFSEAKEVVSGFMVVAADDQERAVEIARECPEVVRPGSSVEMREIAGS